MGKVKIFVDPGETVEEVEDSLFKAISHHNSGNVHENESFDDPAMTDLMATLEKSHKETYAKMIQEIMQRLDKDYTK